jgi:hypothetical protein
MNKSPGTLLIFWDYDTQWGADRSRTPGDIKTWGSQEFENTDELLELHASYRMPACFAIVGAAALAGERPYHDPAQIRRIHQAGHEIASHSFQHDWLPSLSRTSLLETLRRSRIVLEDCIGANVVTFVPPYNRPMDYPARFSFSLLERRQAPQERTDLKRLCHALSETGYRFCRVAYRPMQLRLLEHLIRRRVDRPTCLSQISGISCVRLNTPCGFDKRAQGVLKACARNGGIVAAYGHPHSLHSGNSQDLIHLVPFLQTAARLRDEGRLTVCRPIDLLTSAERQAA